RDLPQHNEALVLHYASVLQAAGRIPESRQRLLAYYGDRVPAGNLPRRAAELLYPCPDHLMGLYRTASDRVGLDPLLATAVTLQESGFDPAALSHNLAGGLMQVMPGLFERFSLQWPDPPPLSEYDVPEHNIRAGVEYLAWLLDTFDGSIPRALAGYNAGEHRVREWSEAYPYPDEFWIEHIPFTQTRLFVKHVLENYAAYRSIYTAQTIETRDNVSGL
ncbi:lytic transglycosylase domain-containing protein, partial [bacterium]|nr:lytic transglycosylase domain-containing protein [candidate division CSSED10-310 bacterium]